MEQDNKLGDQTRLSALKQSQLFSEELGIDLESGKDADYFRWLLASMLYGARINGTIARNTYRAFLRHGLTRPTKILRAGWDFLVNPIMREGGYVRYDGRKSEQVLRVSRALIEQYSGRLSTLHDIASDANDLEKRVLAFYGIGPITMNIFLRELRPYWPKADPAPLPAVTRLASQLAIDLKRFRRKTLTFVRIEAGLIRLSHVHVASQVPSWRSRKSD